DAVSATFLRRTRTYGLPRLTLKGLRHTWATLALETGVHPRVVQERLGHSTIAITLGIYSHVSPTLHDEAAQLIADLVLDAQRAVEDIEWAISAFTNLTRGTARSARARFTERTRRQSPEA